MVEPDALFQIDLIAEQFGLRLVDAHHIGSLTDTIRNHSIFFSKRRFGQQALETFPNGQPIQPEVQIKGTLPKVMGNEALLGQCVSNLLSNGAKFVSPGTTPRMEVSAEAMEDASIRVWFKDNGIGI